jgi:beta-glucosidase
LREVDEEIILAVAGANPRTVVAIVAAGTVLMERWRTRVPGILMAWYAGMEGGHALADVLLGKVDAAGRLPFSMPTSEQHLPFFDRDAETITYDRWHGQRLLDRLGVDAAYPLGYGLSYADVEVREVTAARRDDEIEVQVEVANAGDRAARHVVQVYGRTDDEDAERHLVGFASLAVSAGGIEQVRVRASLLPLARWDAAEQRRIVPDGRVSLEVGAYAGDPSAWSLVVE